MTHERFHTSDTYFNEKLGLWLGWVRDKENEASLERAPIWNARKDIGLLLSGETFHDKPQNDTANSTNGRQLSELNSLADLYERFGTDAIATLNGWFRGVLWDLREQKTILFNDRYGLGRVYYHEAKNGFYFCSEAKSLLRALPELRELDSSSLAEFFSFGCILRNRTFFRQVFLLPPGSVWIFSRNQRAEKKVYFKKESWENQQPLTREEFYNQLKETFTHILPRYLTNGRRLGMSLTGGLDGRMIMAWAKCQPGSLPCYTFGGSYRDCADVKVARTVAEICRQPHQVIPVNNDFLRQFPTLAERAVRISDGTMDVTGSVELFVNKLAREIAPVRLTGNYGSEIMRGNIAFQPRSIPSELFDSAFSSLIEAAGRAYAEELKGNKLSFIAFKQLPWHHYSRLSVEQSQLRIRTPYIDTDLVKLMYQAPFEFTSSNEPSLRLIAEGNSALGRISTDRGLRHRPVRIWSRTRRFLNDFTFKSEYAYDVGMPHWLARLDRIAAPLHLERLVLGRHRFYHFRVWYRDQLAQYLKDMLLDSRSLQRPYLHPRFLEEMVNGHIKGNRNYTVEINKVLSCELLQRQLIEGY
jgi:asparagine synthase (glutamine-hydrolysing)